MEGVKHRMGMGARLVSSSDLYRNERLFEKNICHIFDRIAVRFRQDRFNVIYAQQTQNSLKTSKERYCDYYIGCMTGSYIDRLDRDQSNRASFHVHLGLQLALGRGRGRVLEESDIEGIVATIKCVAPDGDQTDRVIIPVGKDLVDSVTDQGITNADIASIVEILYNKIYKAMRNNYGGGCFNNGAPRIIPCVQYLKRKKWVAGYVNEKSVYVNKRPRSFSGFSHVFRKS